VASANITGQHKANSVTVPGAEVTADKCTYLRALRLKISCLLARSNGNAALHSGTERKFGGCQTPAYRQCQHRVRIAPGPRCADGLVSVDNICRMRRTLPLLHYFTRGWYIFGSSAAHISSPEENSVSAHRFCWFSISVMTLFQHGK